MPPWYSSRHPSWSRPHSWPYAPKYPPWPINQPFQPDAPQLPQWNNPSQGWRAQLNQPPVILPPPQPQPQLTHPALPKQAQMHCQPNPTLNNKKEQQFYSGETSALPML